MPAKIGIEAVGEVHGRLTLMALAGSDHAGKTLGRYACSCGNTAIKRVSNVRSGTATSCGCYAVETTKARLTTHGLTGDPRFQVWIDMRKRCLNPDSSEHDNYGGRGIEIHPDWLDNPAKFIADMGPRPKGGTIERVDNSQGYTPDNCVWATMSAQQNNKRTNLLLTHRGATATLAQWARSENLPVSTVVFRFHRGLPPEIVLYQGKLQYTQYSEQPAELFDLHGVKLTVREWHRVLGTQGANLSFQTLRKRLKTGELTLTVDSRFTAEVESTLGYPIKPQNKP